VKKLHDSAHQISGIHKKCGEVSMYFSDKNIFYAGIGSAILL
jgi:hypothetical protein